MCIYILYIPGTIIVYVVQRRVVVDTYRYNSTNRTQRRHSTSSTQYTTTVVSTVPITGAILNKTYVTHKRLPIYFAIFTNNIWSYLLAPP